MFTLYIFHVYLVLTSPDDFRVLLASIRDKGDCLCPHCLVRKDQISLLGTKADRQRRVQSAREDSERRQAKVSSARRFIYERGLNVNSTRVEAILKPTSLVPTVVRSLVMYLKVQLTVSPRTRSPPAYYHMVFNSTRCSWLICCTKLN